MAKQLELKKVELKVFVDCCDGCKRKIKKVLRSIDGVFSTEIDPLQPKVTVIGNVEAQVLIKKLFKAGKQVQVWSQLGNENAGSGKRQVSTPIAKPECDNEKTKRSKEMMSRDCIGEKSTYTCGLLKDQNGSEFVTETSTLLVATDQQQLNCFAHHKPPPVDCTQQCYYRIASASSSSSSSSSCVPNHMSQTFTYPNERAVLYEDYFSEDNTVGCRVM